MLQDSFTTKELNTLLDLAYASACLTTIGCTFILSSYYFFPQLRNVSFTLVFWLSVSDLFSSITFYLSAFIDFDQDGDMTDLENKICEVQGAMLQYFSLATFLWTLAISISIFRIVFYSQAQVESSFKYMHLFCWGVPFCCSTVLVLTNKIGPAGVWCWIEDPEDPLRFFFFYGPATIVVFINIVLYLAVRRSFQGYSEEMSNENKLAKRKVDRLEQKASKRLNYVILSFAFCWIWGIANRIHNLVSPDNPQFWLYCMHTFFTPLFGFCNSVIYGFSRKLRRQYT
eukprot:TRINITY_DN5275_c0_g1_i1.p1 TRINITY_DN5275_c0_g1~~TRINITY_DN5275_c0_g1_i1.p1  ORF type:complete len:285 (-),score=29.39 TRINITY_DN5275_c0_g1_i1:358-1212(-)